MSEWNVAQPLDYSATGDDIDRASQKIIATFVDVYDKLNRLRSLDASAEHTVGDAAAYSIKIDTSVTPAAILMRNAANTGYIQIGSVAENMGVTAEDVGAIQGEGMGKIGLGAEANLPSTATTYDLYFAYDTGRLYMYRTGAWRVFLSLRFEDLLGISDAVITRDEVAANGANKIPQLNSVGQGEFDITGSAAKIGGKNLYLPELHDNQVLVYNGDRDRWEVAPRDELTNDDVSTTGEPDKIVKTDSTGKAHVDITGNATKIATKVIDVNNLQDGDVLVYDATRGVFYNKQGATVNAQGVVEANVSGSAQKWAGKALQTVGMTDGQILVWSEANQAFINRNQSAVGNARALSLSQDGEQLANYNGDDYRAVNIITPHLRLASHEYTLGQTCFSKNMPSTMYLECVTAGVTQAVEPDFSSATIGSTVADGGAEWKVCGYVNTEVTDALNARVTAEEALTTHDYRQPSTTYAVGDMAYHAILPTGWYLECTTAGDTDAGALVITSPSVGGTVTDGTVVWTVRQSGYGLTDFLAGLLSANNGIRLQDNTQEVKIVGGTSTTDSAYIAIRGANHPNFPGQIDIRAHVGNDDCSLLLKPDGFLRWAGNDLAGSAIVAKSLSANGYIKYASGLIIQWGTFTSRTATAVHTVSFPIAFPTKVFGICPTAGFNVTAVGDFNVSGFNVYTYQAGTTLSTSIREVSGTYFAIGY